MVNQKKYELRIDIMDNEGSTHYLTYDNLGSVTDGEVTSLLVWDTTAEQADLLASLCPTNMKYGNWSCQATCDDPQNENGRDNVFTEEKICVFSDGFLMSRGECISEQDCGCFLEGGRGVFQRRRDGSVAFYRDWTSYRNGFGGNTHLQKDVDDLKADVTANAQFTNQTIADLSHGIQSTAPVKDFAGLVTNVENWKVALVRTISVFSEFQREKNVQWSVMLEIYEALDRTW
ncbi:Ficolin-2 [Holothuria leucospilota]|uniref:Ficolin-2 n=1 Tax=Holothuria leucospilota TaxID=206669 RepID=A0A9Q1H322_HOLLE|nr:Ficolin-2 [Holothuria leucospilota]